MSHEEKLFELLAGKAKDLQRPLKKGEWLAEVGAFLKSFVKEKKKAAVSVDADAIYRMYPKHVAPDDALKAITNALKKHPKEYLLDKTSQFRACVESWPSSYRYFGDGGDRCPHPASWFNAGRYGDDPREWKRMGARNGAPVSKPSTAPTVEEVEANERDRLALIDKYRTMPEPPKGTLEHSFWLEARVNLSADVAGVVGALTSVAREGDRADQLRNA